MAWSLSDEPTNILFWTVRLLLQVGVLTNVYVPVILLFTLVLQTVLSTATSFELIVIPVPAPTLIVLFAVRAPPPVKPLPAPIEREQLVAVVAAEALAHLNHQQM